MATASNLALVTGADRSVLMETLRRAIAHDVRTPLGTIVNYAAILEASDATASQEVRGVARKIRASAMRAAGMLQQISGAISVLSRGSDISEVELAPFLRECFEAASHGRSPRLESSGGLEHMRCSASTCAFLWKTLFQLDRELRGESPERVEYEAVEQDGQLVLTVWLGGRNQELPEVHDWASLMREEHERISADTRIALELSLALIQACRGQCTLHGQLGFRCALRVCVPLSRAA